MINIEFINRNHPLLDIGILSDRGIRRAIENGKIKTDVELDDEQFQPNSLDLRLKSVDTYHLEHYLEPNEPIIPGLNNLFPQTYKLKKDEPFDVPKFVSTSLYFIEKLKTKYGLRVDFRSGRARRGLINSSDKVILDKKGNAHIDITNQGENIIRLYGQDKIAHAFFYTSKKEGDGYVVSDKKELEEIANSLSPDMKVDAPYLVFNAGDFALIQQESKIDDTRANKDLFHKQPILPINIFRERHVVLQLNPKIDVPNNVAIQLLPRIPYTNKIYDDKHALFTLMHSAVVKGGWVESGYKGNVTAHLSIRNNFFLVSKDEPIVYALAYKYKKDVLRPYGSSALNSHYQNSKGDVIKS